MSLFLLLCPADAENGPSGGGGAALVNVCGSASTGRIRRSGGGTPDSGAAPVLRAGRGPLPPESGPERRGRVGQLTSHAVTDLGSCPKQTLFWLYLFFYHNIYLFLC